MLKLRKILPWYENIPDNSKDGEENNFKVHPAYFFEDA